MKINTKATNITLTPAISDYVEKKIGSLDKFFQPGEDVLASVEVGRTTQHHKSGDVYKAEVRLSANGDQYYATSETEDLYAAIDLVKDEITRELTSGKKKSLRIFRKGSAKVKDILKGLVGPRE